MADVNFTKDYSKIRSIKNESNQLEVFSTLGELSPIKWTQSKLTTDLSPSKLENASETTTSDIPLRGAEFAAVDTNSTALGSSVTAAVDSPTHTVITVSEDLPSPESKKYHAWVNNMFLFLNLLSFCVS